MDCSDISDCLKSDVKMQRINCCSNRAASVGGGYATKKSHFVAAVCLVLLINGFIYQVSANSDNEKDSDLVFLDEAPTLEETKLEEDSNLLKLKPNLDEIDSTSSWLVRIKRGLFDFWGTPAKKDETTETTTLKPTTIAPLFSWWGISSNKNEESTTEVPQTTQATPQEVETLNPNSLAASIEKEELSGETKSRSRETRESNELNQTFDEGDSTELPDQNEENEIEQGKISSETLPAHRSGEDRWTDDEDLLSGRISGSGALPDRENIPEVEDAHRPYYYRITLTVVEPYREDFTDSNSIEFRKLATALSQAVESLYDDLPGRRSSHVVKIGRSAADRFKCTVTLDLGTVDYHDKDEIHNRIRRQISTYGRIGDVEVSPEDFNFREFLAPQHSRCEPNELACGSGECLPQEARCNGKAECRDSSDEEDCKVDCAQGELMCDVARCIPAYKRCDGVADCTDGTDERDCIPGACRPDQFRCDNGVCISNSSRCNFVSDCRGGEDERNCPCLPEEFTCYNGQCIPIELQCDGYPNCPDDSDEFNCPSKAPKCNPRTEFTCGDGSCIPISKLCDKHYDCNDLSDERKCPCRSTDFQCVNSKVCIDAKQRCDGVNHCSDKSDEMNCPSSKACLSSQFQCADRTCIEISRECDGNLDCPDGSDERCETRACTAQEFRCNDGRCLNIAQRCNNVKECPGGEDEINCRADECTEFRCGSGECIPRTKQCNNFRDCRDGSDERDCPQRCTVNEFECLDGSCIPQALRCDNRYDCPDGSDERNCPTEPHTCNPLEHRCSDGLCIPRTRVCDGRQDCSDSSDEVDCGCRPDEFTCDSGECINSVYKCDRRPDCRDGSDERNCYSPTTFPPFRPPEPGDGLNLKTYPDEQIIKENIIRAGREVVFQCRDEGPIRAPVRWVRANGRPLPTGSRDVNGRLEMPNIQVTDSGTYICEAVGYGSSTPGSRKLVQLKVEAWSPPPTRPPTACNVNEATCSNGDCIPKNLVCDGKFDCTDGSDEMRCSPHGCEPNEFRCANQKCVLKTWRCDSDDDCGDNSDEENCATNPPGSPCMYHEFQCRSGDQCIPKSFHCDLERDCLDNSDEVGCSSVYIQTPPPPMVQLNRGDVFIITCTAVAIPTPEVVWRLNWGHIPPKCNYTSVGGVGTLMCPDIQESDQGAYSCEAINIRGSVFAVPDTILVVIKPDNICPAGFFNNEARSASDCISCFCFGATNECKSADLFTYQLPPPFDTHKLIGVTFDLERGLTIHDEPIYPSPRITPVDRNGVQARLPYGDLSSNSMVPYFALPENYHGSQLKSYGGYLKYNLRFEGRGRPTTTPDIILTGNGYTLIHKGPPLEAGRDHSVSVRLFEGEWVKRVPGQPELRASRAEIMMALASVENILIKMQYLSDPSLDTTIRNLQMDSAAVRNTGQGKANLVEECRCPVGYTGLSCEQCAPGYLRHNSGPWLGRCYREEEPCKLGTYGDPSQGIPCQVCPCPLTSPSNQFARTCSLAGDGQVTCDCPPGYVGRRCEQCAPGYSGNPLIPGDSCKRGICDPDGSVQSSPDAYGQCMCKNLVTGPSCNQCKPNTFYLDSSNQFGCIDCFCMGITRQCTSSNWYRDRITTVFTRSQNDFNLVESQNKHQHIDGIRLDQNNQEIVYDEFSLRRPDVYYWTLPSRYLGDKVTSYGGYLNYTLRYVPIPGGLGSRNTAPDIELISANDISLLYFSKEHPHPNTRQSFTVPLLEQYWQRSDGQTTDREHLLMALADIEEILIKATYTTNTQEVALISVILDTADERNTGLPRALPVEQCYCPPGYQGLSCEDCDIGYTRAPEGLYLGLCEPCKCNGHSNQCDSETGVCENCRDHTTGENCEQCQPGYSGDATGGTPFDCRLSSGSLTCECNEAGSLSAICIGDQCQCKRNVEGRLCDHCRKGTFALSKTNPDGCTECFCSGVTDECQNSNYYLQQIPMQVIDTDHGFTLVDLTRGDRITSDFELNVAMNEIGYSFRSPGQRLFWSLPPYFTGNKVTSYGGRLQFTLRYIDGPGAVREPDQDVILKGNGITVFWRNKFISEPGEKNIISVPIATTAEWQRLENRSGPRPANREDLLTVLTNLEAVLIRAWYSSNTVRSYLSDITLDTAVPIYTRQNLTKLVELCRCPAGYRGTSCESCSSGYYRDINDKSAGPLGTCVRCPCNGNEESCSLGPGRQVICTCLPGFSGRYCDQTEFPTPSPSPGPGPGPGPSPTITVTITEPVIQIVDAGTTIRFRCTGRSIISAGPVAVEWSKLGGDLPRDRATDDRRGLLVIADVTVSDSGTYICSASDGVNIIEDRATLTVGGSPPSAPRVSITPRYLEVEEGQQIQLTCQSTGNPAPHLRWTRIGGRLNPQHSFVNGLFSIPYASKSDEGEYRCTALNTVGEDTVATTIYILPSTTLPPLPNIIPSINPPEYTGATGDRFTLTCLAPNGETRIHWSKAAGSLPAESSQRNGVLTIYNPKPEDSGSYICTATNGAGTSGTSQARVSIFTNVGPPVAHVEPERQTVSQGKTVELHCTVTGESSAPVKWTKVGEEFGPEVQILGQTLRIQNAQVRHRGVYVCLVENEAGTSQASSVIEVERREAPIIELFPDARQTVTIGSSTLLQCRITAGIPSPTLKWTRPDNKYLTSRTEELPGGVLRFNQITLEEAGQYVCTARNDAGEMSDIATLTIQSLPSITISPNSGVVTVQEGERVRLECRATGEPQPSVIWSKQSDYTVTSVGDLVGFESPQIAVHEITRVTKSDEGIYRCVAKNSAGAKDESVRLVVDNGPTRGDITGEDPGKGDDDNNLNPSYPTHPPYRPGPSSEEEFRVPIGGMAQMRCRVVENTDIHLDWKRTDRQPLPSNSEVRYGVLRINNVQPSDAGEYNCVGILPTGSVAFTVKAKLLVIAPPRIQLNPPRQVVRPGENAYIQCTVTGDAPIDISWTAVGRPLPRSVHAQGGELVFRGIEISDAGKYMCRATSPSGEADAVAEVVVNEPYVSPSIVAINRNQATPPGSDVELRCESNTAGPQPDIRWSKHGEPLPYNARAYGEVLRITNVQSNNAGRYICEAGSARDFIDLIVDRPRPSPTVSVLPPLRIEPSLPIVRLGDTVDLRCSGARSGSTYEWSKPNNRLADNCQARGPLLRINTVRPENAGRYKCEATDSTGTYGEDYDLVIEDLNNGGQNDTPLQPEVKTAPYGSTVAMDCLTDLEPPISYKWTKQNGILPKAVSQYESHLTIPEVTANDAGTYVCTASNGETKMDVPMILVVTGIVPYFAQAPLSYITLPPIPDAYLKFSIEISFKPESSDGLILYNDQSKTNQDFVSLSLNNGYPIFRFNCGSGTAVIQGDRPLTLSEWHTIKVTRSRREGFMYVDGHGPYQGQSAGKHQGLDLMQPLYIGGVPNYDDVSPESGPKTGFVGCISRLVIGRLDYDLMGEAQESVGITTCETCAVNPCHNRGVCQEAATKHGYSCLCPAGFSGTNCESIGEACFPGACGPGRCVNKQNGFDCYCPMGKAGSRCELDINVNEPAFADDAFIAYPTPKPTRKFKMGVRFNAADLKDGILLYCGENDEGDGDFTSLAIKDRHLEFRFDVGSGPAIIRSDRELQPNEWITVSAARIMGEGKLIVNGGSAVSGRSPGPSKALNLQTPLYVGGYDKERITLNKGVGVHSGFEGCISGIEVTGLNLSLITSIMDSANVQDCSDFHAERDRVNSGYNDVFENNSHSSNDHENDVNPDRSSFPCAVNPCLNNGHCYPTSPTDYKCSCQQGFSGLHCEIEERANLCDSHAPCRNGGTCRGTTFTYKCDCPLGFAGTNCELNADIKNEASFRADGYIELSADLLPHINADENEIIALEITTNTSDGLIFWHGQTPDIDGRHEDYISLAVVGGYLEYSWELGTGPAIVNFTSFRVDNGERHIIVLKRSGAVGSIEVDNQRTEFAESEGIADLLNTRGNIYLGGTPNISLMTGGRYKYGFSGCIHTVELQNNPALNLGDKAVSGVNVKPCTSDDGDSDNEIVN